MFGMLHRGPLQRSQKTQSARTPTRGPGTGRNEDQKEMQCRSCCLLRYVTHEAKNLPGVKKLPAPNESRQALIYPRVCGATHVVDEELETALKELWSASCFAPASGFHPRRRKRNIFTQDHPPAHGRTLPTQNARSGEQKAILTQTGCQGNETSKTSGSS